MPGQLRPDTKCPICGRDACVMFRTWRRVNAIEVADVEVIHVGDNAPQHHCHTTVPAEVMQKWNSECHTVAEEVNALSSALKAAAEGAK